MDDIPDVDIEDGRFKYILIKVSDGNKTKQIVRGYKWADYHADIFEKVESYIKSQKLKCECVGGGRIEHSEKNKTINIFGYSQGYGLADHKVTSELIKKEYPGYTVTWSNGGY